MIGIGIDTGGTYTDAVVAHTETGEVLAKAKSLTTKDDLTLGIGRALDALPAPLVAQAEGISLSTTLATNACVEGTGGRAKLVIVGVDEDSLRRLEIDRAYGIPYADVQALDVHVDSSGKDVVQPDWDAFCNAHADFFEDADSFGIAGLHALNNGGAMETFGAEYLQSRYGVHVVKAVDVAAEINVYERAATALLNARLVPVICEFLDAIRAVLRQRGLEGIPVSVVRSDGSIMSAELARERPVETILSGPAASVRGTQMLVQASDALVVDIGGTTSDIALFRQGKPVLTDHITIGGWKTQVAGIAIDTIGLGGDSAVRCTKEGTVALFPQRVIPLCVAATRWPKIVGGLETYLHSATPNHLSRYELFCLANKPRRMERYSASEQNFISMLEQSPVSLSDKRTAAVFLNTDRLEREGVVIRSGMTPTDAMHILGMMDTFDARASELGAHCVIKSYRSANAAREEKTVEQLAREICELASRKLYEQAGRVLLSDAYLKNAADSFDGQMQDVFDLNWHARKGAQGPFALQPHTEPLFVGIGAPTHVFLPDAAEALGAAWRVPNHAEVANAVGAACAQVSVEVKVRVKPVRGAYGMVTGYRMFAPDQNLFVEADKMDDADRSAEGKAKEAAREALDRIMKSEAARRGAPESSYIVDEQEVSYTGAADGQTIVYEWVFTAHTE